MTSEGRPLPMSTIESPTELERRTARVVGRARRAAIFEVVWRRAVPILWVGGLFVALSWLGVWTAVPAVVRLGLLLLLAGLLGVAAIAAVRDRGAVAAAGDAAAAIRRVEAASGLAGHELAGLADRLAVDADPATVRLWQAHRARLAARVGRLRSGVPHPDLGRRDRWALRPALGLLLFVGWFAADGDRISRLGDAFRSPGPAGVEDRLDAWIDPPGYTGRPPLVLVAEGRPTTAESAAAPIRVPQGSRLTVRAASGRPDRPPRPVGLTLTGSDGRSQEVEAEAASADVPPSAPVERTATLAADVEVALDHDGRRFASWRVAVEPDRPPTIRFLGRPEVQGSGALKIEHETEDDWGVASAEARFVPTGARRGRPLYGPPSFPLQLPLGRSHVGKGRTLRDVTAHPFAGAAMRATLVARDDAGQEGTSEAVDLTLPERPFRKPLARALAELRRRLALDAGEAVQVVTALEALTAAPDRFATRPATHLGLRFVLRRAAAARSDDDLREVVDLLWAAATSIEDGDLVEQERALRDAQEALRQALEQGASPEEIARLTRELRRAMEAFLAAKAEQARRDPRPRDPAASARRTLTDRDLQRMLDRIENLAKTGSREAAEQLLQELREMMENLEAGGAPGPADQAGAEALEKLGEMIRRQQKLMEDTHRSMQGEGGDPGTTDLGRLGPGQQELRDTLRRFSEEMKGSGRGGPGEDGTDAGEKDFGSAGEAMDEAGDALRRGEGEDALDAQARALDDLRRGARKLADQIMRRNGRGEGRTGEEDPLGRPQRSRGSADSDRVKVPEEIDVERARRILDDIRRRLGEPARPKFERDYLDRLLKLD